LNIPAKHHAIDVEIHGNFVDGREIEAGNGPMLDVRNPATGEVIAKIPNSTADDIDRAMKSARAAFEGKAWGGMDIRARARLVNRLADAFEGNLDQLYKLETLNNGRPVNETRAQLSRLPDFFRYFAGLALARRDSVIPVEGSYLNYTLRTPIGIVANCTPFNHPLMIMCKSLAAVLASGSVRAAGDGRLSRQRARPRQRLFRAADRVCRRQIRHAHFPGRSVRTLHLDHAVHRRGGRVAACQ
jgi:delta 1-pyrroline-5-carboxylate dehydrogenase